MSYRGYIGGNIQSSYDPTATNPNTGITTISNINWGILDLGPQQSDYKTSNNLPYVVGSATTTYGTLVSSLTFNTPQNNAGDILVAFLNADANRSFSSSGWKVEKQYSDRNPSLSILTKRSSGSEGPTQTFNISGTAQCGGVCISIRNANAIYFNSFGAQSNPPIITYEDNANALENLLLFFIGNNNAGITWDVSTVNEYQISSLITNVSAQIKGIYNSDSSSLPTSYTTNQSGGGSANSYGLAAIVDTKSRPFGYDFIISSSSSITANTINIGTVSAGDLIILFFENNGAITVPTGFTKIVSSETSNPYLVVATKVATGTETTLTGAWAVAASLVLKGTTSVIGTPQGPTISGISTAPSITLTGPSFVTFWTVNNNDKLVTTPPECWSLIERVDGSRDGALYFRYYNEAGPTGNVTAVWDGNPVNSVLVSFSV